MKMTVVYPAYNCHEMTKFALTKYRTYPAHLLDNLEVIIIDDGSMPPLEVDGTGLNVQHYQVPVDIPWNHGGCKNLGTLQASYDWIIYLDSDRIIPPESLEYLFTNAQSGNYYIFAQINHDGSSRGTKKPFGVFCAERAEMLRVKGFDERFCGAYGYEDLQLSKKLKVYGIKKNKLNDVYLVAYDTVMDGKTRVLSRDLTRNKALFQKSRQERYSHEQSLWLNFEWSLVKIWTR